VAASIRPPPAWRLNAVSPEFGHLPVQRRRVLDLHGALHLALAEPARETVQRRADVVFGLLEGDARAFDAPAAERHLLVQQGFQLRQAARLGGEFRQRRPAVLERRQLPQRMVNRHAQALRIVVHWPEQHVVVERLLDAQLGDLLDFFLVAQDHHPMRMRLHRAAQAIQAEAVALRFLERVECQHQHVGCAAIEVLDRLVGVRRREDIAEVVCEQLLHQCSVGDVVRSNEHGRCDSVRGAYGESSRWRG
jgi:hypothetical protein